MRSMRLHMGGSFVTALLVLSMATLAGEFCRASAQQAYGYSSLAVTSGEFYSNSYTYLDYTAQAYYSVETDAYLWAGSSLGASGSAYSNGYIVSLWVTAQVNTTYWIQTNHWVVPISGGPSPDFSCVTPAWYSGSLSVGACGYTNSPAAVYIGTSYATGDTYGNPPSISSLDEQTYGNAQPGTSGYAIVYGAELASPFGPTNVSISGGIGSSVTYAGLNQTNVYYTIPANLPYGQQSLTITTPNGSASLPFIVNPIPQTISFSSVSNGAIGGGPATLSATASSSLPVSFVSGTPAVCTVSGATAVLLAVGACSITAMQAGNATYSAAPPVTQTFCVMQGSLANGILYSYDSQGRLSSAVYAAPSSCVTVTYSYDAAGNRMSVVTR